MTRDKIKETIALLKLSYVYYYKDYSVEELKALIKLWEIQFENYEDAVVMGAVNCLISTCKFPPTISEIKDFIESHSNEFITDDEIWQKIRKAISNSIYNSVEEYNELPEDIKKITSPSELRELATMDVSGMEFIRKRMLADYHSYVDMEREIKKLPPTSYKQIEDNKKLLLEGDYGREGIVG